MTVCDLLNEYDAAVRPSGRTPYNNTKGPVIVTTSLNIRSISAVSEKNMVRHVTPFCYPIFICTFLS
ncbi:hypothetical protein ANCCAN_13732 [Ancylostoma caninum]|uniref:Neurotransmitter-gated ion-channel ligand-binding domain-containing protein n=1 Tax=Ancylostoma caninum TaxID=29170 RepID=A0A368G7D7_ANCCA|nr:hypothetical protein ANCCAN_13732 [Ancylostoma caninum]